jgi:Cu(I)/Ag(I) efflux system protein CusF
MRWDDGQVDLAPLKFYRLSGNIFMYRTLKLLSVSIAAMALAGAALAQMDRSKMDHSQMGHASKPDASTSSPMSRADHMFEGVGKVVAVDPAARKIGLDHGPVPALKWPAMKMAFAVMDGVDLSGFKPGDQVQFTLHKVAEGAYPIAELCKASGDDVVPGLCAAAPESAVSHSGR